MCGVWAVTSVSAVQPAGSAVFEPDVTPAAISSEPAFVVVVEGVDSDVDAVAFACEAAAASAAPTPENSTTFASHAFAPIPVTVIVPGGATIVVVRQIDRQVLVPPETPSCVLRLHVFPPLSVTAVMFPVAPSA